MGFQFPLYAIGTACLLLAGVLASASTPRGGRDLYLWIGALAFVACIDFLLAQRVALGHSATVVLVGAATSLGLALSYLALQQLLAGRAAHLVALAPVPVAAGAALIFVNDLVLRNCVLGVIYAAQSALVLVLLLSSTHQRGMQAALRMLASGFALIFALFVARVTLALYRPEQLSSVLQDGPVHTTTLLFAATGIAVCSLAFLSLRRNRYEQCLNALATRDPLTGILNRRALLELGSHALSAAARGGRPLAVLMLDLDHFKQVNDRHGHAAGDALLQCVAATIGAKLRESDIFGRYGGEEFCIVLPETTAAGAAVWAERIRDAIAGSACLHAGNPLSVTASIGIAGSDAEGAWTLAALIDQSDAALYRAKNNGRNQVATPAPRGRLRSSAGGS